MLILNQVLYLYQVILVYSFMTFSKLKHFVTCNNRLPKVDSAFDMPIKFISSLKSSMIKMFAF